MEVVLFEVYGCHIRAVRAQLTDMLYQDTRQLSPHCHTLLDFGVREPSERCFCGTKGSCEWQIAIPVTQFYDLKLIRGFVSGAIGAWIKNIGEEREKK